MSSRRASPPSAEPASEAATPLARTTRSGPRSCSVRFALCRRSLRCPTIPTPPRPTASWHGGRQLPLPTLPAGRTTRCAPGTATATTARLACGAATSTTTSRATEPRTAVRRWSRSPSPFGVTASGCSSTAACPATRFTSTGQPQMTGRTAWRMSQPDQWYRSVGRRGGAGRGPPRPEPGAGRRGRGAAGAALIYIWLNSAVERLDWQSAAGASHSAVMTPAKATDLLARTQCARSIDA